MKEVERKSHPGQHYQAAYLRAKVLCDIQQIYFRTTIYFENVFSLLVFPVGPNRIETGGENNILVKQFRRER